MFLQLPCGAREGNSERGRPSRKTVTPHSSTTSLARTASIAVSHTTSSIASVPTSSDCISLNPATNAGTDDAFASLEPSLMYS